MTSKIEVQAATERFFKGFYSGDIDATRAAVTETFTLEGPFATAHNVDELLQLAKGLMTIARGHHVLQWVVDGNDVSALYQIVLAAPSDRQGRLMMGGWFTVTDGKLSRGRVIYDSAEFDAIVSGKPN